MPQTTTLRIISGKFRGRALKSPDLQTTHPMGAREKLALFNIVAVDGQKVLDAYAGSGALGIEALSRGAREVVFVEFSPKACRTIRENLTSIVGSFAGSASVNTGETLDNPAPTDAVGDADKSVQVWPQKITSFAENPAYQGYFEVVFADPPYDQIKLSDLELLSGLLAEGGTLALSTPAEQEPLALSGLRLSSTHTYARARITIYRK